MFVHSPRPGPSLPPPSSPRRPQVLLIDDAFTVRRYARVLLEPLGFELREAINGVEAMEVALQARFDLFFVDINMRMMDGLTFLRSARATPELAAIPAVMLSSEQSPAERQRAFAAGANFYLTKPIVPHLFIAVTRALCGLPASTDPAQRERTA